MELCALAGVTRSAYYRWLRNPASISERKNDELAAIAERIHSEHPDMGYRRLNSQPLNPMRNGSQMSLNSSITMMKMCTRSTSAQSSISMIGA